MTEISGEDRQTILSALSAVWEEWGDEGAAELYERLRSEWGDPEADHREAMLRREREANNAPQSASEGVMERDEGA